MVDSCAIKPSASTFVSSKGAVPVFLIYTDALFIAAGGEVVLTRLETLRLKGKDIRSFGLGVFDDSRIFDFIDAPIITAKQPIEQIGSFAAQMLFELIEEKIPPESKIFLPIEIVLR